jgi:transcriptional regulator with XRE-family HTH domain
VTLHIDDVAESIFAGFIGTLRDARTNAGLTQNEVASGMPIRGRAISEWECGTIHPTLGNLIEWSRRLHHRFVVLGQDGEPLRGPSILRPGEAWEHFERRRLASPLRNRRLALGLSQTDVGHLVGVSRDSVQRWELACVPPRPIAHVVWAQKLGYTLALRRVRNPRATRNSGSRRGGAPQMADSEKRRRPGRPGGF